MKFIFRQVKKMGEVINKKTSIDAETGEIIHERSWVGYDGFTNGGYQYRKKALKITYFFDSIPSNISKNAWFLLMQIAELMNEENALVYRVTRKSKFSSIIYKPYDKIEIRDRIRFKIGERNFDVAWRELKKHCRKKIQYRGYMTWVVNPAIISKCKEVPIWLCEEFENYMTPHLSATTAKRLRDRIKNQYV